MTDDGVLILCPHCARGYAWRYDAGNRRVMCHCGAVFRVPLDRFGGCELISKPGDRPDDKTDTSPSNQPGGQMEDRLALVEEPIAPVGFLQSVNLGESDEEEDLDLAEPEIPPANPAGTPPEPRNFPAPTGEKAPATGPEHPTEPHKTPEIQAQTPKRPMIMSYEDAIKADLNRPRPSTGPDQARAEPLKPQPQRRADTIKTPPLGIERKPEPPPNAGPTCPQCQADVPAGIDRCPFCASLLVPLEDEAVTKAAEAAADTELMRILRKRGMEHVVKNVAREAAEREALERKLAREQMFHDLLVPAGAAGCGLVLMLFAGLLGLRHTGVQEVVLVQLFWVLLVVTPSVLGTVLIGQATMDADFHIERIPLVKLAGLILGPWGLAVVCVPGIYPRPDTLASVALVLMTGLLLNAMIGVVYRIRLHQSSVLMLAYFVLAFLSLTMIGLPLARAMGKLP